ncbi:hypothetical protein A9G28_03190 [Gilliamella sp. Fer1-1]|jgi:hypothetical protein|uniref:hypothetical protein n=1 Tax=Gilliamella sp. Fer1-1 TaxID=3120240 RepID=UPI00080E20AB|nr:hypothetical protein [Gilliamella apicola]OCG44104.1 hypothetical protein A9G28_03190 [Gilliamella apicola]
MVISSNKKVIELISHLSTQLNQLGILLQTNIADEFTVHNMASSVHIDILKHRIYLRFKLSINGIELFDNDIINIQITEGIIHATCTVYSNYGIDNVMKYQNDLDDFELAIFDKIFIELLSCITSHINLLIQSN